MHNIIYPKKIKLFLKFNTLALVVFVLSAQLFANQALSQTNTIHGKVTNEKGDAISGATVTLVNTNKVVVANDKGEFVIDNVKSGNYKLKITAVGYNDIIKEGK